ncbi:S-adenosyl-L-methionine-dependent methyltransferase [Usnea florida]
MSTQYDTIGATYEEMRTLPIAHLQDAHVSAATAPFLRSARILDLACGTGYYSRKFLSWGARSVVGIDISSSMIDAARSASAANSSESQGITYHIGDCSRPHVYEGGPFDIVFGAWLLNYASSRAEMRDMFRNACGNLKPGGHFIGVTPPPTEDPRGHTEKALAVQPAQYGGLVVTLVGDVEGGVATHLNAKMRTGTVEFDAFHLRKSVYEGAAREGGLEGALRWRGVDSPDIRGDVLEQLRSPEWGDYVAVPHFSVLVVAKS